MLNRSGTGHCAPCHCMCRGRRASIEWPPGIEEVWLNKLEQACSATSDVPCRIEGNNYIQNPQPRSTCLEGRGDLRSRCHYLDMQWICYSLSCARRSLPDRMGRPEIQSSLPSHPAADAVARCPLRRRRNFLEN